MKRYYQKAILSLTLAVLMLIIAARLQVEAATLYQITDLGQWTALGINNVGQVVGENNGTGYLWDISNGLKEKAGTPFRGGINDSGQALGYIFDGGPGYLWDSLSDQWYEIDLLNGEGTLPKGINNSGKVVGKTNQNHTHGRITGQQGLS